MSWPALPTKKESFCSSFLSGFGEKPILAPLRAVFGFLGVGELNECCDALVTIFEGCVMILIWFGGV